MGQPPAKPGQLDGLNTDDPGVRMLAGVAREFEPEALLLAHCGDLPGLSGGATRLILDVRERTGSPHRCVPDRGGEGGLPFGDARFAAAMIWPRAHLGKDFSEACLATGALGLREGGRLYCAVRKQKGGKSLAKTMRALLGEVEVLGRERGYHLWSGVRGPSFDVELARELCSREYEIRDEDLGELVLRARPGVFSRRELDGGTRALLAVTSAVLDHDLEAGRPLPRRVLDLCAGIGPLALFAATRLPLAEVIAVESNLRACDLLRHNAQRNQLAERVHVHEHDGPPELAEPVDLILLNPPTHANTESLRRLLDLRAWLAPDGRLLLVVSRAHRALELLDELGAHVDGGERDGYVVLQARWTH